MFYLFWIVFLSIEVIEVRTRIGIFLIGTKTNWHFGSDGGQERSEASIQLWKKKILTINLTKQMRISLKAKQERYNNMKEKKIDGKAI